MHPSIRLLLNQLSGSRNSFKKKPCKNVQLARKIRLECTKVARRANILRGLLIWSLSRKRSRLDWEVQDTWPVPVMELGSTPKRSIELTNGRAVTAAPLPKVTTYKSQGELFLWNIIWGTSSFGPITQKSLTGSPIYVVLAYELASGRFFLSPKISVMLGKFLQFFSISNTNLKKKNTFNCRLL